MFHQYSTWILRLFPPHFHYFWWKSGGKAGVSDAATQFRDSLDTSNEEQCDTQRSLADAAAKTRIGGEALAQELETLAANITSAGAAVDQGLRSLEGATDHLPDILTNPLVSSAQAHLESLIHSPLISSVQNTLTAGAR